MKRALLFVAIAVLFCFYFSSLTSSQAQRRRNNSRPPQKSRSAQKQATVTRPPLGIKAEITESDGTKVSVSDLRLRGCDMCPGVSPETLETAEFSYLFNYLPFRTSDYVIIIPLGIIQQIVSRTEGAQGTDAISTLTLTLSDGKTVTGKLHEVCEFMGTVDGDDYGIEPSELKEIFFKPGPESSAGQAPTGQGIATVSFPENRSVQLQGATLAERQLDDSGCAGGYYSPKSLQLSKDGGGDYTIALANIASIEFYADVNTTYKITSKTGKQYTGSIISGASGVGGLVPVGKFKLVAIVLFDETEATKISF